eukprot:GGOE01014634.1.p1 GENE.GGOE01014634.1~~GGOE01014634.1.p1  ORF type:complete len:518 (+),score=101.28 GGOE01014634.1:60-1556(+)
MGNRPQHFVAPQDSTPLEQDREQPPSSAPASSTQHSAGGRVDSDEPGAGTAVPFDAAGDWSTDDMEFNGQEYLGSAALLGGLAGDENQHEDDFHMDAIAEHHPEGQNAEEAELSRVRHRAALLARMESVVAQCRLGLAELVLTEDTKGASTHWLQNMDQVLAMAHTAPDTPEAAMILRRVEGEAEQFRLNLARLRLWPKAPVPIPNAPPNGTVSYFEHPSEGRMKLMWMNPLPLTALRVPSYRCDMCGAKCEAAWSHISFGDERDISTFFFQRVGWDLCFHCFDRYCSMERTLLNKAAKRASDAEGQRGVIRSPIDHAHHMDITAVNVEAARLGVHLKAPATGEYLLCTAAPAPELPDNWTHASVEMLCSLEQFRGEEAPCCSICLDSVLDTTEGRIRPVRTKCNHFFHESCLRRQFRGTMGMSGRRRCPLCRQEDPLDLLSDPDVQLTLQISLQCDCQGRPFVAGAQYLVTCVMAADKALPFESYSSVLFQAVTYPR